MTAVAATGRRRRWRRAGGGDNCGDPGGGDGDGGDGGGGDGGDDEQWRGGPAAAMMPQPATQPMKLATLTSRDRRAKGWATRGNAYRKHMKYYRSSRSRIIACDSTRKRQSVHRAGQGHLKLIILKATQRTANARQHT